MSGHYLGIGEKKKGGACCSAEKTCRSSVCKLIMVYMRGDNTKHAVVTV